MKEAKILIVEDENIVALNLQTRLKSLGYQVAGMASTGEDAAVQDADELHRTA
jgi:CheY-like chemotaxis protein